MGNPKRPDDIITTQDDARRVFDYVDGRLVNRETGAALGYVTDQGYIKIDYRRRTYFAHRLIFLWCHGWWPEIIDHIDRDPTNNRIENLRSCTASENRINQKLRQTNKTGTTGVCWHKSAKKWQARKFIGGRRVDLGRFDNIEDAIQAVNNAV